MPKPKRQHFIPRSYLNNFSINQNGKFFIHAKRNESQSIIPISTKDICVKKNLYTIPSNDETKKYALENFYAENVDGVYPEVYRILTNDDIKTISFETRLKIINTSLSLYFRTPKFLNQQNEVISKMLNDLAKIQPNDTVSYTFLGEKVTFNKKDLELIIKEKQENNRLIFLAEHLRAYEKLVSQKLMDGICVYKLIDDSEFITSDNPVIMRPYMDPTASNFDYNIVNAPIDPFDGGNMIHLPLNEKYILTIMPSKEDTILNVIQRLDIRKIDSLMFNYDIENNSESWILGSKEGIEKHLENQERHNSNTEENQEMFDDYKELVLQNKLLMELFEKYGATHEKTKTQFESMKKNPKVLADPNFSKLAEELEKIINN